MKSLLLFSGSVESDFATPWTVAHQAPLSMEFSRQEYWSGLAFPPPEDLPYPGIKPTSTALAGGFFIVEPPGKPQWSHYLEPKKKTKKKHQNPHKFNAEFKTGIQQNVIPGTYLNARLYLFVQ